MNNKQGLYISVWNKYLAAMQILLKKSAAEEQVLGMNRTDFESAAGIRKSGYRFTINFVNGKPDTLYNGNDLVQAFIAVLQNDKMREHFLKNDYTFVFSNYKLQIKNKGSHKQTQLPETVLEEIPVNG
ncbi:MAG TPA: hypothetical protein VGI61_07360 [Parafilimonas sp.]|jgi:hypothetical protein